MQVIREKRARLVAVIPPNSLVSTLRRVGLTRNGNNSLETRHTDLESPTTC